MRTEYDLEMLQEVGYCTGIENYSMHLDGRTFDEPPYSLLDFFPTIICWWLTKAMSQYLNFTGNLREIDSKGHVG